MFIIDIIPLVKIPFSFPQSLSYFHPKDLKTGGLVLATLRNKKITGIVIASTPLEIKKMEIKKGLFQLKGGISVISEEPVITEEQMELSKWLSDYYISPLSLAMKLFLPKSLEKKKKPLASLKSFIKNNGSRRLKLNNPPLLLWTENRMEFYLKEIEKAIAKKKQVLFLNPETENLHRNFLLIKEKNPSAKIAEFHSDLKYAEEFKIWEKIKNGEMDIVTGTRSAVFLPFRNLGLIIIEEEENSSHKSWEQFPKYNVKEVSQKLSEISGAKLILGSSLPSVESYQMAKENKYKLVKIAGTADSSEIQIENMKEESKKRSYSIFSRNLELSLKEVLRKNGRAILFLNRRGLSTALFCRDCGHLIKCENCGVPFVYHINDAKKPILFCHHCGAKETPPNLCPKCESYRMDYFGSGTQKVIEKLKNLANEKNIKIERLDSDIAPDPSRQKKIIKDFIEKKIDILVCTQLLFKFGEEIAASSALADLGCVVSIDQILNIPDYKSTERVFQILHKMRKLSKKIIIQTYNPDFPIFQYFKKGDIEGFLNEETANREEFSYPPFYKIIKLSYNFKDYKRAEKEANIFKSDLLKSAPNIKVLGPVFGFVPKIKEKYVLNLIIKYQSDGRDLKSKIKSIISKDLTVDVNPESLI